MYPTLFEINGFAVSTFGLMMVLAFVAAYLQLRSSMLKLGVGDEEDTSAIVFAAGVGGILGSKIYYAILKGDWSALWDRAGLVWYGGFFLATLAIFLTLRLRKIPFVPTLDACALALAVGYAVGRIGCFLVGDDYGVPTALPWGVKFAEGAPPSLAYHLRHEFGVDIPATIADSTLMAVHPTQLYETGMALVVWWIGRRYLAGRFSKGAGRPPAGATAALVVALLAVERFIVEIFRAKDDRFFGGLTLAQILSIVIFLAAVTAFTLIRRRGPSEPAPQKA